MTRPPASPRARQRQLPLATLWEEWTASDGWRLRTARWDRREADAVVLFCGGRGDFIEKYAETIHDLLDARLAVVTFDWRGQGLSGRLAEDPGRCHITTFDRHLADLLDLLETLVVPFAAGRPILLMAHSMGGNIALRALHDRPGLVQRAVLLAPMCGIITRPLPERVARLVVRLAVARGWAERFAPGQFPYGPVFRSPVRQRRLTSDVARFEDEGVLIDANPDLAVGGVTHGWVLAAYQSIDALRAPGFVEAIETPVLIVAAALEKLVHNPSIEAVARRLPHGDFLLVPDARHELIKERDYIRTPVLQAAIAYLRGEMSVEHSSPRQ